jgi:hypothetical protein
VDCYEYVLGRRAVHTPDTRHFQSLYLGDSSAQQGMTEIKGLEIVLVGACDAKYDKSNAIVNKRHTD